MNFRKFLVLATGEMIAIDDIHSVTFIHSSGILIRYSQTCEHIVECSDEYFRLETIKQIQKALAE